MGLIGLTRTQVLYIYESTKVIIINKNKDPAFQIVIPSIKGFNNSQELLVVSFIANLGRDNFLKKKDYWILFTNFRQ